MTRILAAALFLAIVVLAFYVGRASASRPSPSQAYPESAWTRIGAPQPERAVESVRPAVHDPALGGAPTPEPGSSSAPGHPWHTAIASWYGPGLWNNRTACGLVLTPSLVGVASRTLPCGTRVELRWHGVTVTAPVVDRGPYVAGRLWDLTAALCQRLGRCFTGPIAWRLG